jgi:hypothetical protein
MRVVSNLSEAIATKMFTVLNHIVLSVALCCHPPDCMVSRTPFSWTP